MNRIVVNFAGPVLAELGFEARDLELLAALFLVAAESTDPQDPAHRCRHTADDVLPQTAGDISVVVIRVFL